MTKLLSKPETVIRIVDDTELVNVEQWDSGLRVMAKKVSIHDFLVNLMDMVEIEDVVQLLHKHELFEEGLDKLVENYGGPTPAAVLSLFLNRVRSEEDISLLASLFRAILEKFDMSKIEAKSLAEVLKLLLHRVSNLEEKEATAYNDLFLALLEKVQISSSSAEFVTQVMRELLKKSMDENDVSIAESMFEVLSHKARPQWVQKVLAQYAGQQKVVRTPILPKNTVFYQEQLDGTKIVCLEIERQQIDVIYHKDTYESVGHPKLLFVFYLEGQRILTCKIFAVKDIRLSRSTELYRFPFSNVFENFSACWPDLRNMRVRQLNQLETLPLLFLKSPSNDHMFRGKNLRELFTNLQGREFDNSLLERTGLTFGSHFEMVHSDELPVHEDDEEDLAEENHDEIDGLDNDDE